MLISRPIVPVERRPLILVVEDEPELARVLVDYLAKAELDAAVLHNGLEVVPFVRERRPDLILLDLLLPGRPGIDVCRELRTFSDVRIIMITALVEEIDRLLGLELGADDYICKPFSPREVVARVKAVLRRTGTPSAESTSSIRVDDERMQILVRGKPLALTPMEFRILRIFATRIGRVYSRDQLVELLHEDAAEVFDRSIDTHIKNIRRKLGAEGPSIVSVYGVGYKLEIA